MRTIALAAALLAIVGCANATPPAATPQTQTAPVQTAPQALALTCAGEPVQGGLVLCRTEPGAQILVDGTALSAADAQGWAVVGFDRFAEGPVRVEARLGARDATQTLNVTARSYNIQRIDGLPQQTVTPTEPAVLARIARERTIKNQGFASRAALEGWLDGFQLPTNGRVSASWGGRRILNGVPTTPHYGVDIAAPDGTPIHAPAAGVVSLAEPDMHYEGGLVFIDHGQGLISMYLHMSRLDVHVGDRVTQGQLIGAVGHAGRATGPHLCWRLKWRDRNLDPSVAMTALATARTTFAQR